MPTVLIVLCVIVVFAICVAITLVCLLQKGSLQKVHLLKKAPNNTTKIACVGASITYGYGVKRWIRNNYPTKLGTYLGKAYCVNNYGYSSRTVQMNTDFPFANEKIYKKSLEFNPDIVIIMFGTNDSKAFNWHGVDKYKQDYLNLIQSYKSLQSSPDIYLLSPTPVWQVNGKPVKFGIDGEVIANQIRCTVKSLAEENNLHFVDMYAVFEQHAELFPDGIHPNTDGAQLLAQTIYEAIIKNTVKVNE